MREARIELKLKLYPCEGEDPGFIFHSNFQLIYLRCSNIKTN